MTCMHDSNVIPLATRRALALAGQRTPRTFIVSIRQRLELMAARARERRELSRLSERELKDLGLTSYDVDFRLRRPLWR